MYKTALPSLSSVGSAKYTHVQINVKYVKKSLWYKRKLVDQNLEYIVQRTKYFAKALYSYFLPFNTKEKQQEYLATTTLNYTIYRTPA